MNCKQARRLMQEIADGTLGDHGEFDRHIAQCPRCRLEWQALQRIEGAVASIVRCQPPAERLERATVGALQTIERQRPRALAGLSRLSWAAAAALLIAVFATGLYAGRTVWPREVTVTKTVKVPEVHEKIVEVEVPVVKERVVVKRVPVYKTRIVYRDREVEKPVPVVAATASPEPVKLDEVVTHMASNPVPPAVQVSEEIKPTTVIGEAESREASPIEGHREQPDATITEAAAEMVIAQNIAH